MSARPVAIWLFAMCLLVALMVTVGGATRLTESGLSITEWKPVTGVVPPLNERDWQAEFAKYQQIPQYSVLNPGMTLAGFKAIYWWEWSHRLLGRLIGFAFLLPLIYFVATRRIGRALAGRLFIVFLLGGAQGALGWYMVKSGLTDRIEVSQYRLAAHLSLAVLLYAVMFWIALDLWEPRDKARRHPLFWGAAALSLGVYLQMMLGAFVAGLRAGRSFNTWPLMDGQFVPPGYLNGPPGLRNFFENIAAVQFDHRIGAYLIGAGAVWLFWAARHTPHAPRVRALMIAVALQVGLGIWTLLAVTPVGLGLAHQLGALIVFSCALYAAHGFFGAGMLTPRSASSSA